MSVNLPIGNGATRQSPAYRITYEGFSFLCMGFTGKEASRRSKVSACAREMRHWRDDKPLIEDRLSTLLVQMQPDLLAVH